MGTLTKCLAVKNCYKEDESVPESLSLTQSLQVQPSPLLCCQEGTLWLQR